MTATVGKPPEDGLRFSSEDPAHTVVLSSSVPVHSEGLMQAPRSSGHRLYSESDAGSPRSSRQRRSRRRTCSLVRSGLMEPKKICEARELGKYLMKSGGVGKRGGRGRWKPYHNLTVEEKIAKDERDERKAVQKRDRLFSNGKPMAPYNTTQFLLEDRERRVHGDSDGDSVSGSNVPNSSNNCIWQSPVRCRECSGSDPGLNSSDSGSVSSENELEREFEADYDSINLVRIGRMSREEVTKEMLLLERSKGKLEDRVGDLTSENERLKKLLEANNIVYDNSRTKRRRSGDSVASEDREITFLLGLVVVFRAVSVAVCHGPA
uniref:Protein HEXIM1 n=1 Tax=Syphacia muris TaxID=451379 RepID=A0A0N5AI95_9BILA